MDRTFLKSAGVVVLAAAAILLVPALAMQFTDEVNWGPGDFAAAGALLLGTGLAYVTLTRAVIRPRRRIIIGSALALLLLLVWAELAVGIID